MILAAISDNPWVQAVAVICLTVVFCYWAETAHQAVKLILCWIDKRGSK